MTAVCFALGLDLETLRRERYALLRSGLASWTDWCRMTRWQRMDLLARHNLEVAGRAKALRGKGWKVILNAIISRLLFR